MSTITSQITSFTAVYSTVYSGADQRKHPSAASLAFVRWIHRCPANSPHTKGQYRGKCFPFDDVIFKSKLHTHKLNRYYSIVYSDADIRKYQSSASLAFVRGIHRWPVNSPHKSTVTRKIFPFDDVIMIQNISSHSHSLVGVVQR